MAAVILRKVEKIYDNGFKAVHGIDLDINDGEFMVFVGPSGCAKSTTLRMIAGLEDVSGGEIYISDRLVNTLPPKDRSIAMVFQNYALYPHKTVFDNMAFGLKMQKRPKEEIKKIVEEVAEKLEISDLLYRKPKEMSGGQRQRVAMGRAIVRQPQVFLMDEPLSNLDAKLRGQMRTEIAQIQQDLGTTTIYVTHDQVEAMTMGDRIALMKKGILQQIAEPQLMYENPDNIFVAGFIGSPPMNMAAARLDRAGDTYSVQLGEQTLRLSPEALTAHPRLAEYVGRDVVIGIRSEDMEDSRVKGGEGLRATANLVEALGSELMVYFTLDARPAETEDTKLLEKDQGDKAAKSLVTGGVRWTASFAPRARTRPGDAIMVTVDTARMHFFDPETSLAIRG